MIVLGNAKRVTGAMPVTNSNLCPLPIWLFHIVGAAMAAAMAQGRFSRVGLGRAPEGAAEVDGEVDRLGA